MPAAALTAAPAAGARDLVDHLQRFFERRQLLAAGDRLLVAASGGADSTALLWGMRRLAERLPVDVHAAHLDHGLDPDAAARAAATARLCARLGVPLRAGSRDVAAERGAGESAEAAARRVRYGFLERQRRELGARWILTAHHADDQAETLLLRCLFGSGLAGLSGIAARRGALLRPLLALRRRQLAAALAVAGLRPVEDPTNRDLGVPRNRVRHCLIPALERRWPELGRDLPAVARAARGARRRLDRVVEAATGMRREGHGVSVDRAALEALPEALWPFALARAARLAGLDYPAGRHARLELKRQLESGVAVGCDQGNGWRWRSAGGRLALEAAPRREAPAPFCRSFTAPGQVEVPEVGIRVRLRPAERQDWMLRGAADRTGLGLRLRAGDTVTVRSRRPGDRIRPLGCAYRRRLKDLLIDRRVPSRQRDRLPLLEVGGRIAWVPGVTVHHECRLGAGLRTWLAEIERT